jgi:hypothetical protein
MEGHVDLRYLFVYPTTKTIYTFDLMKMVDNKIMMDPWEGPIPEQYLPAQRFFSESHTEEYANENGVASGTQKLVVDGEWDMPDFGEFYSRYADVYYLLSAAHAFIDDNVSIEKKQSIKKAFTETPFKGGFSYVNFYSTLPAGLPREERLRMDKIKYESVGYVDVNGDKHNFAETQTIISSFLQDRAEIKKVYVAFYTYLSKGRYLAMSGDQFHSEDPNGKYIRDLFSARRDDEDAKLGLVAGTRR